MKKLFNIAIAMVLLLTMAACSKSSEFDKARNIIQDLKLHAEEYNEDQIKAKFLEYDSIITPMKDSLLNEIEKIGGDPAQLAKLFTDKKNQELNDLLEDVDTLYKKIPMITELLKCDNDAVCCDSTKAEVK